MAASVDVGSGRPVAASSAGFVVVAGQVSSPVEGVEGVTASGSRTVNAVVKASKRPIEHVNPSS